MLYTHAYVHMYIHCYICQRVNKSHQVQVLYMRTLNFLHLPLLYTREGHMYEHVELRPTTEHESAAQHEEIELPTNAAYGRVHKQL